MRKKESLCDRTRSHSAVSSASRTAYPNLASAVNNVGTNVRSLTQDYTDEDYHKVISTNLDSAFLITKVCCPELPKMTFASAPPLTKFCASYLAHIVLFILLPEVLFHIHFQRLPPSWRQETWSFFPLLWFAIVFGRARMVYSKIPEMLWPSWWAQLLAGRQLWTLEHRMLSPKASFVSWISFRTYQDQPQGECIKAQRPYSYKVDLRQAKERYKGTTFVRMKLITESDGRFNQICVSSYACELSHKGLAALRALTKHLW